MSLFSTVWATFFGGERNVVRETVEVFRENAEGTSIRAHDLQSTALQQFAAEFASPSKGGFDRFMDGVNRLPRPLLALGALGLMAAAMVDPLWFAARMQGIALVPEPLWWLLGIIVSFYFGARSQAKAQDFQEGLARSLARVPQVVQNIESLNGAGQPNEKASENPALDSWVRSKSE